MPRLAALASVSSISKASTQARLSGKGETRSHEFLLQPLPRAVPQDIDLRKSIAMPIDSIAAEAELYLCA
jgi:hypothetical protein